MGTGAGAAAAGRARRWARVHRLVARPGSVAGPAAGVCAIAIGLLLAGPEQAVSLVREWGAIENGTAGAYGLVVLALLAGRGGGREQRFVLHSALVVALLTARELDLHKAFTPESVLAVRFYKSPAVPLEDKLLAALVVALIAWVFVRYLAHAGRLRDALRAGEAWAYSLTVALCLLPLTKLLDAAPRIARDDLGVQFTSPLKLGSRVFEEVLELGIPLLMLWAIGQFHLTRRAGSDRPAPGRQ